MNKRSYKLKNFEEIKNIEVDNVYDYATSERVDGILYNGEKVVEGVIVRKNNKNNILKLFFYENGQSDGINYQYFSNGNLSYKALYEKDILVFSESYLKDGKKIEERYDRIENNSGKRIQYYKDTQTPFSEVYVDIIEKDYVYNGPVKVYFKTGELKFEFMIINNVATGQVIKEYYKSGDIKRESVLSGTTEKFEGTIEYYKEYYSTGALKNFCKENYTNNWTCTAYTKDGVAKTPVNKTLWINRILGILNIWL